VSAQISMDLWDIVFSNAGIAEFIIMTVAFTVALGLHDLFTKRNEGPRLSREERKLPKSPI